MVEAYRGGIGRTRRELHRVVDGILFADLHCPPERVVAFCRLLDENARFNAPGRGEASRLRMRVFKLAAERHPLVATAGRRIGTGENLTKSWIARRLGTPWPEIDTALFGDVDKVQQLVAFKEDFDAFALLARYNVAQVQACLLRARRMVVTATDDFKVILRYAKLARLMHLIERLGPGRYRLELTGPASDLHSTRRYGICFARVLPAIVACRGWSLRAEVATPSDSTVVLELSAEDGLRSHLPAPKEFDSKVEASFADRFGEHRNGWRLERESEILHSGQATFFPDFVFRHDDGTQVLFEIVGFWTPSYLEHKRRMVRRFAETPMILAVARRSLKREVEEGEDVVAYGRVIGLRAVVAALERVRDGCRHR
jgi:predicted nuclease of restriction endonuclease-like RecB superfamily